MYVEAFGQKFATDVKQACLSCVFDETFVISLRHLDKDEFEEGVIRCSTVVALVSRREELDYFHRQPFFFILRFFVSTPFR